MKKKDKLYKALCFYLPYDFQYKIQEEDFSYTDKLTGSNLDHIYKYDKFDDFKLLGIRSKDSISVKEMKEAAMLFVGGEIFNIREDGITMVHHLRGGPDIYPEFNLTDFFNLKYGRESLDWILSKGFDIFGLIEMGVA